MEPFASWDCDLEEVAHSQLCYGLSLQDIYAVLYNNMNVFANVTRRTISELEYWWSEAEEIDLSVEPKYSDLWNDYFAYMAYAKNTRFACTYGNCSTGGVLQCVYEQKPHDGELIYRKTTTPKEICTACPDSTQCVNFLCQKKNPESSTTARALHHFSINPPMNSASPVFQSWDCELEKIAKSQVCNPDGIPPEYDSTYDVIILDSNAIYDIGVQTRAVLRKWTKGAEMIDLSVEPKFDPWTVDGFGRMVYAKSTRIGCSMDYCDGTGMLMCVYDKKVNKDRLLYKKTRHPNEICTACPPSTQCVNYLCKTK
ncbi:hypothetical protein ANCCAN_09507 [Ancylostoma caninum]|uniref:SCP domain-containing protein n=1 Tax=Ancylostoma caninum TaxID=29170 RepID=A0A368GJG2_ANCCA|nr:hypothetical protein ANCCAN_09507 [Ancylostoma caninum]